MNDLVQTDNTTGLNLAPVIDNMALEMAVRVMLKTIERDEFKRQGLEDTPKRAAAAWKHWTRGYHVDPASVFKCFEDGSENYDEMLVVCDIPVYSTCEHHLAAIFGRACVGYVPKGRIIGLSKIHRLVDVFARRLQTQERLTTQISDCLWQNLAPKGVGVILRCRHLCIESRGVAQQGTVTTTSALQGVMKEGVPRSEFLTLAKFEAAI